MASNRARSGLPIPIRVGAPSRRRCSKRQRARPVFGKERVLEGGECLSNPSSARSTPAESKRAAPPAATGFGCAAHAAGRPRCRWLLSLACARLQGHPPLVSLSPAWVSATTNRTAAASVRHPSPSPVLHHCHQLAFGCTRPHPRQCEPSRRSHCQRREPPADCSRLPRWPLRRCMVLQRPHRAARWRVRCRD